MLEAAILQCAASMPDKAGWLQDDLHLMVPCMIAALAILSDAQPALTGRLKTAAMQLLPPLLAGLHVCRLTGESDRLRNWFSVNGRVSSDLLGFQQLVLGTGTHAWQASAHACRCIHRTS